MYIGLGTRRDVSRQFGKKSLCENFSLAAPCRYLCETVR